MPTPLRALIVEDSEIEARSLLQILERHGFRVTYQRVETAHAMQNALALWPWDIVIADYSMPQFDGLAALKLVQSNKLDAPFILVACPTGEDFAIDAIKAGAQDYLLKDQLSRLGDAIERELREAGIRRERRRAEEQLRQSEEKYRLLVENANSIIIKLDAQGHFTFVNEFAQKFFGYKEAELMGKPLVGTILPPADSAGQNMEQMCADVLKHPDCYLYNENENMRRNGQRVWVAWSNRPLYDGHGKLTGLLSVGQDITARKRAEDERRASEISLAKAQHIAHLGSWELDLTTGTLSLSDEAYRIFGITPPDFEETREAFYRLVHPEDRDLVRQSLERAVAEKAPYSLDYRIIWPDGTDRIVHLEAEVSCDSAGRPVRVFGAVLDITALKPAELALRKVNRALRAVSACKEAIMRATDESALMKAVCEIVVRVGGYRMAWVGSAEQDTAKTVRLIGQAGLGEDLSQLQMTWADNELGRGPVGAAIRTGKPCLSTDLQTDPGFAPWRQEAIKWGCRSAVGAPLIAAPQTLGVLVVFANEPNAFLPDEVQLLAELADNLAFGIMTLRRQAAHRDAEERTRSQAALIDQAQAPIAVYDLEGRIRFWSHGAERLYGWTAAEVVGRNAHELIYAAAKDRPEKALQTVLETGTWQGELLQATKAARELVVLSSWTLMRDLAGKPKSILTITTDITAQKRIEAQTLRAQRMESTGRLASGIAHDLNNVLAPILMALQMLREQAKDESAQALLQTLETSAKRGGDIVRQVQIFARGIEGERIPLNAKHLIREMERIAGATFSRNIKTCAEAPPGLWLVTGDATQLHQVLMNLCVNARDAMPYGGTLALAAENVTLDDKSAAQLLDAKAGHYVRLTVADTGSGIAPEILDKIFDPFFTTKGSDKGTGLGLSTVLGIVRSHGGFVEVQSKVGYGSRFEVYLPAIPESQPAAVAAQRQAPPQGQGETILVVDDEQTFREVTEGTLTQNGYKALTANDGTEAIALFAQNRDAVKVVLIDMMMPFMDGPATIRAMRRLNPQIKLIGVSGLSAGALPPDVARLELQAFLHKPFTAEALLTALHEAICHADISH